MFKKETASREKVKLMVGLTGPSGSGKTLSALKLARGITDWANIVVCDTENKSALYYAGPKTGNWEHIDFNPSLIPDGYHPSNWIKLIEFVESDPKAQVLILDSISHEWEGKGGCLDINQKLGGRYTDWARVTPLHNAFIDKMRHSRLHIIATMRSVSDYALETNEKGKPQPVKIGLKSKQKEGTDYEFGIVFDIEINHHAKVSKDRTGLFSDKGPFQITAETGKELLAWTNSAPSQAAIPEVIYDESDLQMKRDFAKICAARKIVDKLQLIGLSAEFKGHNMADLEGFLTQRGFSI